MKNLLVVTALLEIITGVALFAAPALTVSLLLGAALDAPAGLVTARVAGAALLALGVICWLARDDGQSRAARGLLAGMFLYNAAAVGLLVHAGLSLHLSGVGLWPAALLHLSLAGWCTRFLRPSASAANRGR